MIELCANLSVSNDIQNIYKDTLLKVFLSGSGVFQTVYLKLGSNLLLYGPNKLQKGPNDLEFGLNHAGSDRINEDLADLMPIALLQMKGFRRKPGYLDRKRERYTFLWTRC